MHKDQTKFQINGDNGKLLKNPDSKKDINDHVDEDDASRDKSVEQQGLPVDRGWAWVVVVGEYDYSYIINKSFVICFFSISIACLMSSLKKYQWRCKNYKKCEMLFVYRKHR
jgi:hypothetical protein